MLKNPARRSQGGDVEGETKIDVTLGEPISVASASFDPGYPIDVTLENGYVTKADLKQGYAAYGKGIGEGR